MKRLLPAVAALALAGCADLPAFDGKTVAYPLDLVSGETLFEVAVDSGEVPDVDILKLSPEMSSFIEQETGEVRISAVKFRRMFGGLSREGYFDSTYLADRTNTAAETFETKSGNCLSYTNMFVALSRAAGLDARYQIVKVPPSWDADSGYLIRYTHINVLMRGVQFDKAYGPDFAVDFNDVQPDPEYPRRLITDEEATALYYANRSVNLFREGDHRLAFAYLKKGLEITPDNSDLWINLGAFFSKLGRYDKAVDAYTVALSVDRRNRGAISGLARAHDILGNVEQSEYYSAQVRRYRDRNPYFHFAIAQSEFERERYAKALDAINAAIQLKGRSGRFYFMKGLTEQKLGEIDAARMSFKKADRYGNYRDIKRRYVKEVASLTPIG